MTRRDALSIVAALLTQTQAQAQEASGTCHVPETLVLDLGAAACRVKQVQVKQGALTATISVDDLLTALGATVL